MTKQLSKYQEPQYLVLKVLDTDRVPEWMHSVLIQRNKSNKAKILVPMNKKFVETAREVNAEMVTYNYKYYINSECLEFFSNDTELLLWLKLTHKYRLPWLNMAQSWHDAEERRLREVLRKKQEMAALRRKAIKAKEKERKASGVSKDK